MAPLAPIDRLGERAAAAGVPLFGSLELTWRCNFRCVHCYQDGLRDTHRELTTAEWKRLLDEIAELGCIFLTFTGGEPLLRPDFSELYEHAFRRGFVPTVFTNGALVDAALLDLWERMPPKQIELTLYGASEATYARVTERGHVHERVASTVDRILERGLRLVLKAPAMRPLLGDLHALAAFAEARGLHLQTDSSLFPRLDGHRGPLAHRLSPEEAVALTAGQAGFAEHLDACFGGAPPRLPDRVYRCGAANYAFNVDPSGHLQPCVISRGVSTSFRQHGAAEAWRSLIAEGRRAARPRGRLRLLQLARRLYALSRAVVDGARARGGPCRSPLRDHGGEAQDPGAGRVSDPPTLPPRQRRPYRPPEVNEIVLDPDEAFMAPCAILVGSRPPCPIQNHSVIKAE